MNGDNLAKARHFEADSHWRKLSPSEESRLRKQSSIEPTRFYGPPPTSPKFRHPPRLDEPDQIESDCCKASVIKVNDQDIGQSQIAKVIGRGVILPENSAAEKGKSREFKTESCKIEAQRENSHSSHIDPLKVDTIVGKKVTGKFKSSSRPDKYVILDTSPSRSPADNQNKKRHKDSRDVRDGYGERSTPVGAVEGMGQEIELSNGVKSHWENAVRSHSQSSTIRNSKKKRHKYRTEVSAPDSVTHANVNEDMNVSKAATPNSSPLARKRKSSSNIRTSDNDTPASLDIYDINESLDIHPNDVSRSTISLPKRTLSSETKSQKTRYQSLPARFPESVAPEEQAEESRSRDLAFGHRGLGEVSPSTKITDSVLSQFGQVFDEKLEKLEEKLQRYMPLAASQALSSETPMVLQQPSQSSRKQKLAALRLQHPPLSGDVPAHERKSDAELIECGRIITPWERHYAAPYAFSWYGCLKARYKYLISAQKEVGMPQWTEEEEWRVLRH